MGRLRTALFYSPVHSKHFTAHRSIAIHTHSYSELSVLPHTIDAAIASRSRFDILTKVTSTHRPCECPAVPSEPQLPNTSPHKEIIRLVPYDPLKVCGSAFIYIDPVHSLYSLI